jgi:hypothetical protein
MSLSDELQMKEHAPRVSMKRLQWRLQILTELCDACDIVSQAFMHRRSPRSRRDGAVSLCGELRHPTVLFRNIAEACCSIGNLAND